jgi:hypothetical protein
VSYRLDSNASDLHDCIVCKPHPGRSTSPTLNSTQGAFAERSYGAAGGNLLSSRGMVVATTKCAGNSSTVCIKSTAPSMPDRRRIHNLPNQVLRVVLFKAPSMQWAAVRGWIFLAKGTGQPISAQESGHYCNTTWIADQLWLS